MRNPASGCYNTGDGQAASPRRRAREPRAARAGPGRARWIMDCIVKIYLLSVDGRRSFFYADESEPSDDGREGAGPSGAEGAGWRGWLQDRWHWLQSVWEHSEA